MSDGNDKNRYIHNELGFTYMEVMMAFMIFGLMFVFVARLGNSIYDINRVGGTEKQMLHLAELYYENYKTGINDIDELLSTADFTLEEKNLDSEDVLLYQEIRASDIDGLFDITIEETYVDVNTSRVSVLVTSQEDRFADVVIEAEMM